MAAFEDGDVQDVVHWLKMGQDPNCTLIDSALCLAAKHGQRQVVRTLLKGQADVNFTPPGLSSPLQNAVVHDAESCASLLLWSQANPNAVDHTPARNTPLVLAAAYRDEVFVDKGKLLNLIQSTIQDTISSSFGALQTRERERERNKKNKMKPTNPNADTYVEEQRQYLFLTFSSEPICGTP